MRTAIQSPTLTSAAITIITAIQNSPTGNAHALTGTPGPGVAGPRNHRLLTRPGHPT
jgi:hypothetical protein